MNAPRILVVDDDASFRRVLEYQLKEAGYDAVCAADGKQALDLFSADPFHAVLTDLDMPRVSGNDLLRQIKRESPDTPVIVITAYATVDSAVDAMKAGAFHYLTKPLNRDALLHTLKNALEFAGLVSENPWRRFCHQRFSTVSTWCRFSHRCPHDRVFWTRQHQRKTANPG